MNIGGNFLFVHLPKCGGFTIRRVLIDYCGGESTNILHTPLSQIKPKQFEGRHVIGSIRNPYSYYVSKYAIGCIGAGHVHGAFRCVPEMQKHYNGAKTIEGFRGWLKGLYIPRRQGYEVLKRSWTSGLGLLTQSHRYFFNVGTKFRVDSVIRIERLHAELHDVMVKLGYSYDVDETIMENVTPHFSWEDYYDIESEEIVFSRDRFIFETYGYDRLCLS